MKIGVSSYSFQRLIGAGGETQLSVIRRAAQLGFDAIEFTDLQPHDGSSEADYAARLRDEAARCGIEISAYAVGADLLGGCGGDLAAEVERLHRKVDVAAILGAKILRHDAAFVFPDARGYRGFASVLPRLAEGCRAVTAYAAEKGVKTAAENHGTFCQDSDRVEQLVNTVAHDNFGLLVDMGNFLCVDEDPAAAVGRTAPYAFHVHAKDFLRKAAEQPDPGEGFFLTRGGARLRGTVLGHGVVPVKSCLAALRAAGYDGTVSLEFEGAEEVDYALRAGLAYLRRLLAELG